MSVLNVSLKPALKRFPLFSLFTRDIPSLVADEILTPLPDALKELERRRLDPKLTEAVRTYLHDDIPEYCRDEPVLYLARHIATPNFETKRFVHLTAETGIKTVLGQDTKDIFVPQNPLKYALGKMPIHMGTSKKDGKTFERFQNIPVIDFNTSNGKPFNQIKTLWGEPLPTFHARLCEWYLQKPIPIVDDADWIGRNGRGNLLEHYKRFLALFIRDGILFEDYIAEDKDERQFILKVLRPAFSFIEKKFGVRPLIANLATTSAESGTFWYSYPSEVKKVLEEHLHTNQSQS
jgi:hypothetical protein